ncbi:MAG: exopolysaccharide transport family protein [Methylocystis sp.]|nr:exopolysaccharide transport family protein [Methylocystis sp.]
MNDDYVPENDIDLFGIGRALARHRWWVIAPTLLALVGSFIFVSVVKPRYAAEARVLLESQENFLGRSDKIVRNEQPVPDAEAVGSQIQLLTSRDLARRAIKALDLQGNVEFDPLVNGVGPLKRALILLGISRDPTRMSPEDRILEKFSEKLAVLSPTKTRVLSIEFSSEDPDLAARAANVVADVYLDMQQDAKRENARAAATSLATLVTDLKARLAEAETRVEEFRNKAGLLIGSNNVVISTQQLGELNAQLSQARASQADTLAKARLLRDMLRQGRVGDVPDVANNEVMRRIYEQRVSLRAQLALESRTLLPLHPRIKELTAQLKDLDAQWRGAAERTARTLENEARIAGARVENLTAELEGQKRVAGAAGADEVHLRELESAAKVLKEQVEAESAKYQEALARERLKTAPTDARIIQRALAPQMPAFPKKIPITLFATFAGLFLSAGTIVSLELLRGRRASPAPHRVPAPMPVVPAALAAKAALAETVVAAPAPKAKTDSSPSPNESSPQGRPPSTQKESALNTIDRARRRVTSVKVLVAPCAAEGKSAEAAIALGRNLARRGRALLVAADPGPACYERLIKPSPEGAKGLADLLAGEADFGETIFRDLSSRLHVMPGGSSAAAMQHDLALIVEALSQTYDFVIFAASPAQARIYAPLVDLAFVIGGEDAEALRDELARTGTETHLLEDGIGADDLVAA